MNLQSVGIGVWLGIPVLALIWANLNLWRAHRLLKRQRQSLRVPESRVLSPAGADKSSAVIAP